MSEQEPPESGSLPPDYDAPGQVDYPDPAFDDEEYDDEAEVETPDADEPDADDEDGESRTTG
jgi:hypothetical protein